MSKSWSSAVPPLFSIGSIEFHTDTQCMLKRMNRAGANYPADYLEGCSGVVVYEGLDKVGVLYVGVFDGKLSTAVHELFHASVRYLAWVGVPLEHNESNEVYAYFLEWLTGTFAGLVQR